jgi:radical SAM superfamily enzyme YgiQ (UPF0313 family)
VRLLLINPRFPESFWTFKWAVNGILPRVRATNPPLGLATLAALTPAHWHVTIVDENVESVPLLPHAEVIGICGMGVQFARQCELAAYFRARGYFVVVGGSYASLCPEKYAEAADSVVAGEAEYIWPRFCRDFELGKPGNLYRETGTVALTDSPVPRFDLLKLDRYSNVSLQYSRGCPYRCEFCDIIVMFGRRPRTKTPEQIGRELDVLRAQGVRRVFFVDDNLIGHRPQVKVLLKFLADYQRNHQYGFSFGTEASLNLARDPELLELFRAANFTWVFIGIETTDEESLKETKKTQNIGGDVLEDVRRIYAYGIDVLAGFIIGFDNDTLATFDAQRDFIVASGIQSAMIGLLHALPHTPLQARLQREGRLREQADACNNTRPSTNIVPKRMDYAGMVARYELLYRELLTDEMIARRIINKARHMSAPLYSGGYRWQDSVGIVWRLLRSGILPGGIRRWSAFLHTLPLSRPRLVPMVVSDWIVGLSMADFVQRRFVVSAEQARDSRDRVASLEAAISRDLASGKVSLSRRAGQPPVLALAIRGRVGPRFFRLAGWHLERILRHPHATVSLTVEALVEAQHRHLEDMLRRLSGYGDRVSIRLTEGVRSAVRVDSSVFDLVLAPRD